MGNSISLYSTIYMKGGAASGSESEINEEKIVTLYDSIDFIASYYIFTMNFESLKKLHEKKYCDDLMFLTSDIIHTYYEDRDVSKLMDRVESGSTGAQEKENIVYFKQSDAAPLDDDKKRGYCNQIAKFYIQIAHVFSAIVTTINPEYTYKDAFGTIVKRKLSEKNTIPSDAVMSVSKINICSERIDALQGSVNNIGSTEEDEIHPSICDVNMDKNGETMYLDEEPGIQELIDLYYDNDYDYKTGKFMGMSAETEKQFQQDLARFYEAFTGETDMPDSVKTFRDIKLRDYSTKPFCVSSAKTSYAGTYKDELFLKYATHLKSMIANAHKKQEELLAVLNRLFVYVEDPITQKDVIRIHPELDVKTLQQMIVETRSIIIELYLDCETNFAEGVNIYEAIVESQILDTTQKHIVQLEKEREILVSQ